MDALNGFYSGEEEFESVSKSLAFSHELIKAQLKELQERERKIKKELDEAKEILDIFQGLKNDWQQRFPGEYEPQYSFVDKITGNPVFIKGLLGEQLLKDYCLSANEYEKNHWDDTKFNYSADYKTVPPWVRVISASEIYYQKCPLCKKETPLLMSYEGYETGSKTLLFIICCGKKINIKESRYYCKGGRVETENFC